MRILVVIGAGASFDAWPSHIQPQDHQKLPLANELFSSKHYQDIFLSDYRLMGLASKLRRLSASRGKEFDIELELSKINSVAVKRNDLNTIQDLFKARFYLHRLITTLSGETLKSTRSHTVFVDLLNQIKDWIDDSRQNRFVDIVTFNYDDLIENAMENVYNVDWDSKNKQNPLSAYYSGQNLKIYKPHGSINWGREVTVNDNHYSYISVNQVFEQYNRLELQHSFQFIKSNIFTDGGSKIFIPAIAVPLGEKTSFDECPQEMQQEMVEATREADKIITLGWKGADQHFNSLLKNNPKVKEVYVISPGADTKLDAIYSDEKLKRTKSTFRHFVSDSDALESLLRSFNSNDSSNDR